MNRISLIGNVGAFISETRTKEGKEFISFSVAENYVNKETGEKKAFWHDVKCGLPLLKAYILKNISKGDFVRIEGGISNYRDDRGGFRYSIWVWQVRILRKKPA